MELVELVELKVLVSVKEPMLLMGQVMEKEEQAPKSHS